MTSVAVRIDSGELMRPDAISVMYTRIDKTQFARDKEPA
jgi:hypothetical protein